MLIGHACAVPEFLSTSLRVPELSVPIARGQRFPVLAAAAVDGELAPPASFNFHETATRPYGVGGCDFTCNCASAVSVDDLKSDRGKSWSLWRSCLGHTLNFFS